MVRKNRLFLGAVGAALVGLAIYGGVIPLFSILVVRQPGLSTSNLGIDSFFLAIFAGLGGYILFVAVAYLRTRACGLVLSSEGMTFRYPGGNDRVFRWSDPDFRLSFDDYLVPQGLPGAGKRVVRLAPVRLDKTYVPPELLDDICAEARGHGLRVKRVTRGGALLPERSRVYLTRHG
jgi:hypothetical protein